MRRRARAVLGCLLLACLPLPACSGSSTPARRSGSATVSTAVSTASAPSSAQAPAPSTPAAHSSVPAAGAPAGSQLPGGGRTILGRRRVVAYYGAAGTGTLGILGDGTPQQAATAILRRARGFAGFGEPVLPAMELLATVAQGSPGPDGDYSAAVPAASIRRYLSVAHAHGMVLILDLQPGRASFLSQAELMQPFLLDPSVQLALDPEWKVGPGGRPGNGLIGSSSAAGINAVGAWLSALIRAHHLPDKLLIVHQFTFSMLPDRQHITQHPGVEMVLHADGFGRPASKVRILHELAFPHPPFGTGFKLFVRQDSRLMSPAEVMRLKPRPDVITYE